MATFAIGSNRESSVVDKNCLSYWFPKLQSAGIPVPKTEILMMPEAARAAIWELFDGKKIDMSSINQFATDIEEAAKRIAGPDKKYYPYFLRTGQTSHKHAWEKTCRCSRDSDIPSHIIALAEFSEMADFIGLPWHTWVVREMLPTTPLAILPKYGNFPLVPEVRCFIGGGEIKCWHSYWPEDSIRQGGCDDSAVIKKTLDSTTFVNKYESEIGDHWYAIASDVAKAFSDDDEFSVDLIPTKKIQRDGQEYDAGWFVTDMALARRSFHWDGCPIQFK